MGLFDSLRRQLATEDSADNAEPLYAAARSMPQSRGGTAPRVHEITVSPNEVGVRVGVPHANPAQTLITSVDMQAQPRDDESLAPVARSLDIEVPTVREFKNPLRDSHVDLEIDVDTELVEILSLSGIFEANTEQRKLLCLLSDGRLLVPAGKERYSAQVLSYIALLERHNYKYRPIQTRHARIAAIYEQAGPVGNNTVRKGNIKTKSKATALSIITDAAGLGASDIHLEKLHDHALLKFRIDGELETINEFPPEIGMALIRTFYQVLADIGAETFKENARLDARIGRGPNLPKGLDGVRIATTPTAEGSKIVMRLLYSMVDESFDLAELGMGRKHTEDIEALKELPIGLNIISGPTGSGKSTTLQRTLRGYIDQTKGTKHVITVEDPPEYPIPGAVQTPVANASTQAQRAEMFTAAIGSAMRLDPDVIMIGEVRDLPSAELALRAATTGHQVWTTLHANNALNIVDRLVNMGMEKDMLLDHTVLTGLVSQRLIRKLCKNCKRPLRDNRSQYGTQQLEVLQRTFGKAYGDLFVTGPGCDCCRGGTAGRTVVLEVIRPTAQLCLMLQDGKRVDARKYWLQEMGGATFMQHAIEKIREGIVDPIAAWKMLGPIITDAEAYSL